jgi:hypothetical protein
LFEAELKGKKYGKAVPMAFNSDGYSTGHPAISKDGRLIVFSSDRPGGQGGSDLYMSYRNGDTWGEPENLGFRVNTAGDEMFPFLLDDGTLLFSSNGHAGLGGLDLFSAQQAEVGFVDVTNLGVPINSPQDDFSMIVTSGGRGYFSSNRSGGKGSDDIYFFQRLFPAVIAVKNVLRVRKPGETRIRMASCDLTANGTGNICYTWTSRITVQFPKNSDPAQTLEGLQAKCWWKCAKTSSLRWQETSPMQLRIPRLAVRK